MRCAALPAAPELLPQLAFTSPSCSEFSCCMLRGKARLVVCCSAPAHRRHRSSCARPPTAPTAGPSRRPPQRPRARRWR
jgi:hypothetical protein